MSFSQEHLRKARPFRGGSALLSWGQATTVSRISALLTYENVSVADYDGPGTSGDAEESNSSTPNASSLRSDDRASSQVFINLLFVGTYTFAPRM